MSAGGDPTRPGVSFSSAADVCGKAFSFSTGDPMTAARTREDPSALCGDRRQMTRAATFREISFLEDIDMNEKDFDNLLRAARGCSGDDARMQDIRATLEALIRGEFRELSGRRFRLAWATRGARHLASVKDDGGTVTVSISRDVADAAIRPILRHELLHAATGRDDADPLFMREARRRKIDLWDVGPADYINT